MEALNDTVDQRRANIADALSAWVATSRRGRVRAQCSDDYIIVGAWVDKGGGTGHRDRRCGVSVCP